LLSAGGTAAHAQRRWWLHHQYGFQCSYQWRTPPVGLFGFQGSSYSAHQVHGHRSWTGKIRVNAICPSFVETELTAKYLKTVPDADAIRRERVNVHPSAALGQPEDLAGLTVYLASEESSWVTGAVFPVDGGYLAV